MDQIEKNKTVNYFEGFVLSVYSFYLNKELEVKGLADSIFLYPDFQNKFQM